MEQYRQARITALQSGVNVLNVRIAEAMGTRKLFLQGKQDQYKNELRELQAAATSPTHILKQSAEEVKFVEVIEEYPDDIDFPEL